MLEKSLRSERTVIYQDSNPNKLYLPHKEWEYVTSHSSPVIYLNVYIQIVAIS